MELIHFVTLFFVNCYTFPPFIPDLDLLSFSFGLLRSSSAEEERFFIGEIIAKKDLPLMLFVCEG